MAVKKWVLSDHSQNGFTDEIVIRPEDVGGRATGFSVSQRQLKSGLSAGVTVIRVDNGAFSFDILPTRGMGIWKAWAGKEEIGWQSPIRGPVHPMFVPISEPSGLGWLDGFDELLVRCGLESNGAPEFDAQGRLKYPVHGRIANRPAYRVDASIDGDTGEITVTGEVEETRFHFLKLRLTSTISTKVGELGFRVHDQVLNLSRSPASMQMLYHVNFGRPLLDAGAQVRVPAKKIVPRNARAVEDIANWDSYAAEQPGFAEQVYFLQMHADANQFTEALLRNAHATRGVSLRFNSKQLPCFTVWKNTTSAEDGYVTGLEPGTNFPNPKSFEEQQRRVVTLAPGASTNFDLQLVAHIGEPAVADAERTIETLQRGQKPQIFNEPQADWCAPG